MDRVELTIPEIVGLTGVTHPNVGPHADCTAVVVAWNEQRRIGSLLGLLKRWFEHLVVGVQESTDSTLKIAESLLTRPGDLLLREPHHGTGDASMPRLIGAVDTRWAFVVACDERPNKALLESLGSAMAYADHERADALWIGFTSITEGIRAKDTQSGHLRLFHARLGWPRTMHSRPQGRRELWWPYGRIIHKRSIDEMMVDYLRYFELGRGNAQWEAHNRLMMHDACVAVAARYGWDTVTAHEWWPAVKAIAFAEEETP